MATHQRSRSPLIVVLLVATLAMTALLAYQAQEAARSHRATAEGVLRDYATFAAWELARHGRQQLMERMNRGLDVVRKAHLRGDLSLAEGSGVGTCPSGCASGFDIRAAFHMSLPDRTVTWSRTPHPAVAAALKKAVDEGLRDPDNFTCPTFAVVQAGDEPVMLVWRPGSDRSNRLTEVVGAVTAPTFVADVFSRITRQQSLLPTSLVRSQARPNDLLSVRITTPSDEPLYASSTDWSPFAAGEKLPLAYGNLRVAAALKPDAAETLVIGGLPRQRLPIIVGLLALTAGLVVVAVVQLRREAEIGRMRADFVSGVSHELRTPLAQIRMFTETLLLGRVRNEAEVRRSLEIVSRETQRLSQLVENVLLFSRGERRVPEITCEPARLSPLVTDVIESFAPLAAARRSTISTDLDPAVHARVDAGAVRQILLNLLDNAVKYGPAGQTVRVTLSLEEDRASLRVEDEGPGVDPADAERVWQPFHRLSSPGTATGGAGIGLAIVRQLAGLHGGLTRVERGSTGARFIVELPGAWRDAARPAAVA